jgi:hypothetical protein
VVAVTGADFTLQGLTVSGGTASGVDLSGAYGAVTLSSVVVSGNSAPNGGGVIGSSTWPLAVIGSTIEANTATGRGGGLWIRGPTTFDGAIVRGNAADEGGGLFVDGVELAGTGEIQGNTARVGAGAFLMGGSLDGIGIVDNHASELGGGIWLQGAALANAVVSGNSAVAGGGVAGSGSITRGQVSVNVATGYPGGGGLFTAAPIGFDLLGVTVADNVAQVGDGGGLYATGDAQVTILDDAVSYPVGVHAFVGNSAPAGIGGGLAVSGAAVEVVGGSVTGGSARLGGALGVLANGSAPSSFALVEVSGNGAEDGGAFYLSGDLGLVACTVAGNVAAARGGGAYVDSFGELADDNSVWTANGASTGGAVHTGGFVDLSASRLLANTSGTDGAALFVAAGSVTCNECAISDSVSPGAAVDGTAGLLDLGATTFAGNLDYDVYACGEGCTLPPLQPVDGLCDFADDDCGVLAASCTPTVTCP